MGSRRAADQSRRWRERHGTIDRAVRLLGLGETDRRRAGAARRSDGHQRLAVSSATETGRRCLRAGRKRQHRGLRRPDARRGGGALCRCVGPRRRGLRPLGGRLPSTRSLVAGIERADSWACDGHKWLNVPYDSGYAFCAHPEVHATAMAYTAPTSPARSRVASSAAETSSSSRPDARAALRRGRRCARSDARVSPSSSSAAATSRGASPRRLGGRGHRDRERVVLNQVLVRVGDAELTDRLERAIQDDGTCWMGATTWRGERLLRIAVSNWSTTQEDVDLVAETVARLRADSSPAPVD